MQEILKPIVYVFPFVLLAMILGSKADTDWGAIAIGVVIGCIASALWVAFRKAVLTVTPAVKDVFREPVPLATQRVRQRPVTVRWWDVTGREVGDNAQIEAPRSVAVANEKGVVRK